MENNKYQEKLEQVKYLLKEKKESLQQAQEFIDDAEDKFVGKYLTKEIERWTADKQEQEIYIEALDHLQWELENFLKQDAEIETTQSKVQAEMLNEDEPK